MRRLCRCWSHCPMNVASHVTSLTAGESRGVAWPCPTRLAGVYFSHQHGLPRCTGHASSHLSPKQNLLCPQSQVTVTKSDVVVSHYSPSIWEGETEERSRPVSAQWVPTVSICYVGRHCLKQNKTKKQKEITVWRNREIFSRAGSALRDSQETVDRVFIFILETWKANSFQNIHK